MINFYRKSGSALTVIVFLSLSMVLIETTPGFSEVPSKTICEFPTKWLPPDNRPPVPGGISKQERARKKRLKKESRQRVDKIDSAIKKGDRYFLKGKSGAAIQAYQRVVNICDSDDGYNMVFEDNTLERYNYAVERIKLIKEQGMPDVN